MTGSNNAVSMDALLEIMARLRDPDGGCPWDLEQSFSTIAPYTLEEAYEVADAIDRGDMDDLKEELGDLLFQVVYHAQMASEAGHFAFAEVLEVICEKMIRRHPHVFGEVEIETAAAQTEAWEKMKAQERAQKKDAGATVSLLANVPVGLPALLRALKLQKSAARVGFDWDGPSPAAEKISEELEELLEVMSSGADPSRLADEVGDLLFSCVNLARHLGVDPDAALRRSNAKFQSRFEGLEAVAVAQGRPIESMGGRELDDLWEDQKAQEGAAKK